MVMGMDLLVTVMIMMQQLTPGRKKHVTIKTITATGR
jgi:hypothetical protein